jgi:transposase
MEADSPFNPDCPGCRAAAARIARLESRVAQLEELIEQLRRGGKRQAAPFSKAAPKSDPKPPGRKSGEDYGTHARHALQTSDALGCCASQLGPDAQAAIVQLNKQAGLSHGKISSLFSAAFGIRLSRGGVCQAMLRAAGRCLPQYHQILLHLPSQPWVVLDETGWRVGGLPHWLHVAVTEQVVAFAIARERGFEATRRLLPMDYSGTLIHDGWAPYLRFFKAEHQTCIAHLLRRSKEILDTARGGAVVFPRQIKGILQEALESRDRRDAGEVVPATAQRKGRLLRAQVAGLCEPTKTNAINERFAGHLYRQQNHLFTFLKTPGIDATNYRAEQALRNPITNRKVWGGNRTETGAAAQGILCSIWGTAVKNAIQPFQWISQLLRSPAATPSLLPDTG